MRCSHSEAARPVCSKSCFCVTVDPHESRIGGENPRGPILDTSSERYARRLCILLSASSGRSVPYLEAETHAAGARVLIPVIRMNRCWCPPFVPGSVLLFARRALSSALSGRTVLASCALRARSLSFVQEATDKAGNLLRVSRISSGERLARLRRGGICRGIAPVEPTVLIGMARDVCPRFKCCYAVSLF